jgi:hypothetical protein
VNTIALRSAVAAVIGAASLTIATDPAVSSAREWDIGQYDNCISNLDRSYAAGDITDGQYVDLNQQCCRLSGGDWTPHGTNNNGTGTCGAPPAVAASDVPVAPPPEAANPDVPAGSAPPTKPGPKPMIPRTLGTPTSTPVPVG